MRIRDFLKNPKSEKGCVYCSLGMAGHPEVHRQRRKRGPKKNIDQDVLAEGLPERLRGIFNELANWLPSETDEFREVFWKLMGSFPCERAEEIADWAGSFENLGWQELKLIGDTITAIDNCGDFNDLTTALESLGEDE